MRFSTAIVLAFLSGLAAAKNATELEALVTDPTNPQNLINCPPGGGADGCAAASAAADACGVSDPLTCSLGMPFAEGCDESTGCSLSTF